MDFAQFMYKMFFYMLKIIVPQFLLCGLIKTLPLSSLTIALLSTANVGLGTALGATAGGPLSAPNLNTPGQLDPSSIERAYAALGLTYQGNQAPSQPSQQTPRPLNAMGKCK